MRSKRERLIVYFSVFLGLAGAGWFWRAEIVEKAVYHIPIVYGRQLHDALGDKCDRIVIREGGYNCCGSIDGDPILFDTRDPIIVAEVFEKLQFEPVRTSNSLMETCMCCGYPGIDFYKGNHRLANTSVQHAVKLRWAGFSTARVAFRQMGYGDAPLTKESQAWLEAFLSEHCGITLKHPKVTAQQDIAPNDR